MSPARECYVIKKADLNDYDGIIDMIQQNSYIEDQSSNINAKEFKRDAENGLFHCLVAKDKLCDRLLGFALYCYTYSTRTGITSSLEDVFVRPQSRQQGIGSNLIRTVARMAVERNCKQMRSVCSTWNIVGMNLHKSLGADDVTEEETYHMIRFERRALRAMIE